MLTLNRRCLESPVGAIVPVLSLPFETRQKSRFRAALLDGSEVAVLLDRGQVLRHGEHLCGNGGFVVRVEAAPESVSEARTEDPLLLMRASYHLGNRHVPLQILPGGVRYLHDHVLDDMVRGLGLGVSFAHAPFEPESGAYANAGHGHPHGHAHGHGH